MTDQCVVGGVVITGDCKSLAIAAKGVRFSHNARIFRLKGKGIARIHDYGRGDQLVSVQIDVPSDLNAEQKRLLKEYARISGRDSGPRGRSFMEKMARLFK